MVTKYKKFINVLIIRKYTEGGNMCSKIIFKKKFGATVLITTFFVSLIFLISPSAEATTEDEMVIDFTFQEPIITEVNISNITYHKVTMNETQVMDLPRVPLLPIKLLKILLPQNATLTSINVTYEENTSLGNGFNVILGSEQTDFNSSQQNQSNEYNFNTSLPYPTELFNYFGIQGFRGYKILLLNLYPVRYINDTGEIYYYKNMTVTIKTEDSGSAHPFFRDLSKDKTRIIQTLDINEGFANYTAYNESICNSSLVPTDEEYDMVIITTKDFESGNSNPEKGGRESLTFQDLAYFKNNEADPIVKTAIIYVEDILNCEEYHWDGCWGDGKDEELFNDTACHIRNFIKDAYSNWGIEYVLLGGDADIIPDRQLWFNWWDGGSVKEDETSSDLYYACLDGNYNNNANEYWGERTSDGDFKPNNLWEPYGGGAWFATAQSSYLFDAGLFTSAINLTGYNNATLNFSKYYYDSITDKDYWAVRVYSGGTNASSSILEEELEKETYAQGDDEGMKIEFTLENLSNYTDPSKVYIEFYYYNFNDDYSFFRIDEVSVKVPDGDYWEEILFESFEGDEFPPEGWEQIQNCSPGVRWRRRRYNDNLDLIAEVYVGRAPVSNETEVDYFVTKTKVYEQTLNNTNYIKNALWLGSRLECDSYPAYPTAKAHKDEMLDDPCTNHSYQTYGLPDEYTVYTLYDAHFDNESDGWGKTELLNKIHNNGIHLINHLGHGYFPHPGHNYFYFSKCKWDKKKDKWVCFDYFNNDDCKDLSNPEYFFMYSQACHVGKFSYEDVDCLAEYLTVKIPKGAFAIIMNSNGGIMSPDDTNGWSQRFDREFWDAIYGEDIYELGRANQDSKEDNLNFLKMEEYTNPNGCAYARRCYYQLNLFGDPSVQIKLPSENNQPYVSSTPEVDSNNGQSYIFKTNTTDPEGDQVSYKWKIDDTECSYWTKYYNSGENASQTLQLPLGNHQIRVKSRDTNLYESN